jgi:hypothetical protein
VGVNAWERWGAKATVWHRREEGNRWETRGGINTLRSGSATVTFESPEPPSWISKPPGTDDFSRLTREQPGTSGKNSEVLGKVFSRLRQLADRSFVAGIILVLE